MNKKYLLVLLSAVLIFSLAFSGCSSTQTSASTNSEQSQENPKELPTLKVGYIFTDHQTPLMLAASKGEVLKSEGIYLKEIINKQKYQLMDHETPIANLELVVTKSGSETMTMMAQEHIDLGLASNTSFITARDKGNKVKILCPIHTEGIGLVVDKDSHVNNWDEFEKYALESDKPIKVGYHSPTSAPLILFEAALQNEGLSYTYSPEDLKADILLVDLKNTGNLIPSLTSKQVDAWVGPSPFPQLAVTQNVGKIALDMKHLPPEGRWYDFPCCVAGATEKTLATYPEEIKQFVKLLTVAANYCTENMAEAAEVTAEFTGVSVEAAKMSSIKYTTNPSEAWISNMGITYETLKKTNKLCQDLADKDFENAKEEIFDLSFINSVL